MILVLFSLIASQLIVKREQFRIDNPMTFSFEPVAKSRIPDEDWELLPNAERVGEEGGEKPPFWRVQRAYNILFTWEEETAFADGHNACFLEWLHATMTEEGSHDIITPCLLTEMEWNGAFLPGRPDYPRPSLLLLHANDEWFVNNSIPLFRPTSLNTEAFYDQPQDCTINIL